MAKVIYDREIKAYSIFEESVRKEYSALDLRLAVNGCTKETEEVCQGEPENIRLEEMSEYCDCKIYLEDGPDGDFTLIKSPKDLEDIAETFKAFAKQWREQIK